MDGVHWSVKRALDWDFAGCHQGNGCERCEAKAIDEMQGTPWRLSTKHRGTKIRAHVTDDENQGDEKEEEPAQIQMEIYHEEDPGETVDDIVKKQEIIFSRIGQSCNFTVKTRDVLEYRPHLGCQGCQYIGGEVATQSDHSKECRSGLRQRWTKWTTSITHVPEPMQRQR